MIPVLAFEYGIAVSILGACGALLLKLGARNFSLRYPVNFYLVLGFLLYIASTVLFILGLKISPLSFFYPFTGLLYVFAFLLGVFVLKEKTSLYRWFGLFSILLGILLVSIR